MKRGGGVMAQSNKVRHVIEYTFPYSNWLGHIVKVIVVGIIIGPEAQNVSLEKGQVGRARRDVIRRSGLG